MPWNEPGGKDKDPWGNKGKSDDSSKGSGGADIEEITRKMNEKLGGLFGNKSGKGNGGPSSTALILIGLGLLLAWMATGFYTVDSAQRGVVFHFGAFKETTRPGLHWHMPYPVETVELVDIDRIRTADDRTHMLTKDENIVDIGVAAQYKIKNPEDYLFNLYLPDYEPNQSIGTLFQVMRSSVREVAGRNTMDEILKEKRESIAPDTQQLMQKVLDSYKSGLEVIKVNVTYAEAPQQVKDAFDDANRAREDKDRFKNHAETYAKKVVPVAEGKASRLLEAAAAYKSQVTSKAEGDASRFSQLLSAYEKAPDVTRKRLYLETMENVFENTNKVMVDTKSSNNLLYLPLNKLQGNNNAPTETSSQGMDALPAGAIEQAIRNQKTQKSGAFRSNTRSSVREGR